MIKNKSFFILHQHEASLRSFMPFYKRYSRRRSYRPRTRKSYRRRTFRRSGYRRRRYYRRRRKSDTITGWFIVHTVKVALPQANTNGTIYGITASLSDSIAANSRVAALTPNYRKFKIHKVLARWSIQGGSSNGMADFGPKMNTTTTPWSVGAPLQWPKLVTVPDSDGQPPTTFDEMMNARGAKYVDLRPGRKVSRCWSAHALQMQYNTVASTSYVPSRAWCYVDYPTVRWWGGYYQISNAYGEMNWENCHVALNIYAKISFKQLKLQRPTGAIVNPP